MTTRLQIASPEPFDFEGTVRSHGWYQLAPLAWSEGLLERIHRLPSGQVVRLRIRPGVMVEVEPVPEDPEAVRSAVRHMLRLDEDLSAFHARCRARGDRWASVAEGRGRILRSPTVFEDVVKTVCTTNVRWSGTRRMVRALVDRFGAPWPGDPSRRAFPTAEVLAAGDLGDLGLGYRARYVAAIARRTAEGDVDLSALLDAPRDEARAALLDLPGVGPYASASLLMLLGHYADLPVDSVYRQFVRERWFDGEAVADAEARAVYDDWGRYRALAYWFDLVGDG